MPGGVDSRRPAVGVRIDPAHAGTSLMAELLAGLEEEGIPAQVEVHREPLPSTPVPAAVRMAHDAAQSSTLEVGLGLDARGSLALHHRREPLDRPVMVVPVGSANARVARVLGMNAARLVKVQPLELPGQDPGREAHAAPGAGTD